MNQPNNQTNKKPAPKRTGSKPSANNRANNNRGQSPTGRSISRGAALRAQKMAVQDANRVASQYLDAATKQGDKPRRANVAAAHPA
jgi:hypothetical protein